GRESRTITDNPSRRSSRPSGWPFPCARLSPQAQDANLIEAVMNDQPLNTPLSVLIPPSARRRRATRQRPRRALVLSEELSRDVLRKERKRADRSSQSAVLLLVAVNDGLGTNSPSTWAAVT